MSHFYVFTSLTSYSVKCYIPSLEGLDLRYPLNCHKFVGHNYIKMHNKFNINTVFDLAPVQRRIFPQLLKRLREGKREIASRFQLLHFTNQTVLLAGYFFFPTPSGDLGSANCTRTHKT